MACWAAGQQVKRSILHLGHVSYQFISFAQVVPGPVQPCSAESWPKTPFISFHFFNSGNVNIPYSNFLLNKAHNFHTGLFTEHCFVLAEGWYEDEVFHVNAFGFPPPEPAKVSR